MAIQRYVIGTVEIGEGIKETQYVPDLHGEAVMYKDHSAEVALKDQEIARLVRALREAKKIIDNPYLMVQRKVAYVGVCAVLADYPEVQS